MKSQYALALLLTSYACAAKTPSIPERLEVSPTNVEYIGKCATTKEGAKFLNMAVGIQEGAIIVQRSPFSGSHPWMHGDYHIKGEFDARKNHHDQLELLCYRIANQGIVSKNAALCVADDQAIKASKEGQRTAQR